MADIHLIAECGTNHNGSLEQAMQMAQIAADCGADSYKVQIINPWGLYLPGEYEYGHYDIKQVLALRHQTVLTDEQYRELAAYCKHLGIAFTASVFDIQGLDLVCSIGVPYIKIASCDLDHLRFLREVAGRKIKIVLSTGMSEHDQVLRALDVITAVHQDIVLMHCVSSYPASLAETRLPFIHKLKESGFPVGFSDHTQGTEAALMALAMGASWFEKHYTQDRTQIGLDHKYAMQPDEFRQYASLLHQAVAACELPSRKVTEAELYTSRRARRSLYAARDLQAGDIITADDVLIVRPQGPLSADQADRIIGRKLAVDLPKHAPFTFGVISDEI